MNNRIPSGSLSVVADAKEIIGSSASSESSKIQEGRSAKGISIKPVDHSNLYAAMKKAASYESLPDQEGALHHFEQVNSSGNLHFGIGRELAKINNILEGLRLQLQHDHTGVPFSCEKLHGVLEQFKNVSAHFDQRSRAIEEAMSSSALGAPEIFADVQKILDQLNNELEEVSSFLNDLENAEMKGGAAKEGITSIHAHIIRSFSEMMTFSKEILSNLHALESRSSTPPSTSSDRNSSSEKETSSTNTLGIYTDEGSSSDDSNVQVPHLNNANMSNRRANSRPQAAVGSRLIDVTADAKLIRSHQQDQQKEVTGEEAPETDC